jgi:hypothetical protein
MNNVVVGFPSSCRQTLNTETVKLQVAVLPAASVAVQVTVVVPTGTTVPDGGTQAAVTPGQLSVAVGFGNVAVVDAGNGHATVATAATFVGHVMLGGCVSFTVTVNEQVAPPVSLQVTVVVPTGKNDPEAGLQVTVPQVPLVVGAG